MPDRSREQLCYDVLLVSGLSLSLSNRRFDGENIIVLRRVNRDDYICRKAAEYRKLIDQLSPGG